MFSLWFAATCFGAWFWAASATPILEHLNRRTIDQSLYDDLVFHFQYASSSYSDVCAKPNGNTFIIALNDTVTDTQGYIARDDTKKEIVFVFRGSSSVTDTITDFDFFLTDYQAAGVTPPSKVQVHHGFQQAYQSVEDVVIATAKSQLAAHPGYTLVTSGHSLGAALSSLAAVSLKGNFPSNPVTMYTYGQPRTGNSDYAAWVDSLFPDTAFRSTHTSDGVPTMVPRILGFKHHGVEYWAESDPSSPDVIKKCSGDEDATCSDSIPSGWINTAHLTYFNIPVGTTFCS